MDGLRVYGCCVKRRPSLDLIVPKRLRVGRVTWNVDVEAPLGDKPTELPFKYRGVDGLTEPRKKRVRVGRHLRPSRYRNEVLLHELLHVCFPTRRPLLGPRKEEQVVNTIAPKLLEILEQCRWRRRRERRRK